MPRPSQAAKDAAFQNQERATLVTVASGPAAAAAALIPVAGPFIALAIAGVGASFGLRAVRQGRLAHDPPRDDFTTTTTLPPPSFDVAVLGQRPIEVAAHGLISANDTTASALEAMVLALERASGAERADDSAMREARTSEAYFFARLASQGLRQSSERAARFRAALEAVRPEAMDQVQELGVPTLLRTPSTGAPREDPIADLEETLGPSAESDYECARVLERLIEGQTLLRPGIS